MKTKCRLVICVVLLAVLLSACAQKNVVSEPILALEFWTMSAEELDAQLIELGWTVFEEESGERIYEGRFQGQPTGLLLRFHEETQTVKAMHLITSFYLDDYAQTLKELVEQHDAETPNRWSPLLRAEQTQLSYSDAMAQWLWDAKDLIEDHGGTLTKKTALTVTAKTAPELSEIIHSYYNENAEKATRLLSIPYAMKYFTLPSGAFVGLETAASLYLSQPFTLEDATGYIIARYSILSPDYAEDTGDQPQFEDYSAIDGNSPGAMQYS